MPPRNDRNAWRLGEPGAELQVPVRARRLGDSAWRVVAGCLALLFCAKLEADWDGPVGNRALGALLGVGGLALILSGRPRSGLLRVASDTLIGPRWGLVFTRSRSLPLQGLGSVGDVPTTTALGAPGDLAEVTVVVLPGNAVVSYLVRRAEASELSHRLRLRIAGASLGLPQASRLMELYFRPGPKPLGLAYLRDTWVPFESPRALFEASTSHPFRDRQNVQVFMGRGDFQTVVDAYPQLPLERVAAHVAEAS